MRTPDTSTSSESSHLINLELEMASQDRVLVADFLSNLGQWREHRFLLDVGIKLSPGLEAYFVYRTKRFGAYSNCIIHSEKQWAKNEDEM